MTETPSRKDLIDESGFTDIDEAKTGGGRSKVLIGVMALLMTVAAAALVWSLLDDGTDEQGLLFVIPAGSSNRIVPELQSAVEVPNDIVFGPGEVAAITVINEDVVTHRAGPFLVAPGQTFTQRFEKPGEYPIACSIDPADSVVVTVEA